MSDPLKGAYLGMPTEQEWRDAQAALALAETMAATTISFILLLCRDDDWHEAAHDLNNKVRDFRKANHHDQRHADQG